MGDKYFSTDVIKHNCLNASSEATLHAYDWIAWKDYSQCPDNGYVNLIQSYISIADSIANILREEVGQGKRLGDAYTFLFSVRQALEMLLKRLAVYTTDKSEADIVKMSHSISDVLYLVDDTISWNAYDLSFDSCKKAVDFLNDKDQLVKYPMDKKGLSHPTYMICISDWLHLVHELYKIYVDCMEVKIHE